MAHPVVEFFTGLIPQKDCDAVTTYWWQWRSVALGVGTLGFCLYLGGVIPGVDSPFAFAKGSDPNTVESIRTEFQKKLDATNGDVKLVAKKLDYALTQLKDGQIRQLNSDLIDAQRYKCRAQLANDEAAKPFWTRRVQELKRSYSLLANEPWPDLDCKSF